MASPGQDPLYLPKARAGYDASIRSASSRAVSLEVALQQNLVLEDELNKEFAAEDPDQCLQRLLSVRSVISTASSFAQRQQAAVGRFADFREIGTGSVGKIFEHPGTLYAYKLPLTDARSKMWNNFTMHKRIETAFAAVPYSAAQVEVPRCFWYATPDTAAFWETNLSSFPDSNEFPRAPRDIICMERIFPLPLPVGNALIDKFCPPQNRNQVRASQPDKDCLVRPLLGRLKHGTGGLFFTLRNFKLHANQIEMMKLDLDGIIDSMAHALAVLHWQAHIDLNDAEFVLGSSPLEEQRVRRDVSMDQILGMKPNSSTYESVTHAPADFTKRVTSLWLIDFDDCGNIETDAMGAIQAAKAFVDTNFYCPRPGSGSDFIDGLWAKWTSRYLHWSDQVLAFRGEKHLEAIPRAFLTNVVGMIQHRKGGTPSASSYTPEGKSQGQTGGQHARASSDSPSIATGSPHGQRRGHVSSSSYQGKSYGLPAPREQRAAPHRRGPSILSGGTGGPSSWRDPAAEGSSRQNPSSASPSSQEKKRSHDKPKR